MDNNLLGTQSQKENYHPIGGDVLNFGIDFKEERIRLARASTDIDLLDPTGFDVEPEQNSCYTTTFSQFM